MCGLMTEISSEHMPKVGTVFVRKSSVYWDDDPELWAEIKQNGDAVIMAIGH